MTSSESVGRTFMETGCAVLKCAANVWIVPLINEGVVHKLTFYIFIYNQSIVYEPNNESRCGVLGESVTFT